MFDCCRIPGEGLDWSISYAEPGDSGHIIAIRKNRLWKIDVARNGRILGTQEIEKLVFSRLTVSTSLNHIN
jgi:carnitine O-acetyltransferase